MLLLRSCNPTDSHTYSAPQSHTHNVILSQPNTINSSEQKRITVKASPQSESEKSETRVRKVKNVKNEMCRVGICSLSPSLASFHVSHMCSLLLFLNAEAKVKNECWLLFELGYRFLSLPEANLHGVQFSFFIFMLARHFIFHFFAVGFQHLSEYI